MLATVLLGACDRRPPTEENVRKALDEANIDSVEVHVDGDANIVHLTGTVDTLAERTRAEEIAAATVGTTGRVVNDLTVEALDEPPDDPDEQLAHTLDGLIDGDAVLRERDVNVHVSGGVVTITGEVRTAAEKARVGRFVRDVPGVAKIDNQLTITNDR